MADELIRVLIVDDIEETRINLRKVLSFENRMDVVGEAANGYQAIDMAVKHKPDIILMDINMPELDGIQATEKITVLSPSSSIIVISVQGEKEYLKRAMLAGAKEFLIKPFTPDEVNQTIINVFASNKKKTNQVYAHQVLSKGYVQTPKIVSVLSGKGGVGKSLIAVNLATGLKKMHKKVVVIDLDLMFGDVASLLNVKVKETIYHVVQELNKLDGESILPYLSISENGIYILSAPVRPEQSEIITGKHIEKILRLLKENFDYIIVDTPAMLTDPVLALESSDLMLLVNTLNVPVIKHNKTILEIMNSLNYPPEKIRLILNRADIETGVKPKDVRSALGLEPFRILPEEKYTELSINTGQPLIDLKPGCRWSKQMGKLVKQIMAEDERKKINSWLKPFSRKKEK